MSALLPAQLYWITETASLLSQYIAISFFPVLLLSLAVPLHRSVLEAGQLS